MNRSVRILDNSSTRSPSKRDKLFKYWDHVERKVQIIQNMGKERKNSYRKSKRSPEERHTQTD